jgi:hypothetical protein
MHCVPTGLQTERHARDQWRRARLTLVVRQTKATCGSLVIFYLHLKAEKLAFLLEYEKEEQRERERERERERMRTNEIVGECGLILSESVNTSTHAHTPTPLHIVCHTPTHVLARPYESTHTRSGMQIGRTDLRRRTRNGSLMPSERSERGGQRTNVCARAWLALRNASTLLWMDGSLVSSTCASSLF